MEPDEQGTGRRKRELTAQQARFVDEYLVDGNGTQAAIRAGYSEHSAPQIGSRLLRHPLVAAALAERQTEVGERLDLEATQVLAELRLVVERCLQAMPVLDGQGREIGEWRFDAAAATQALALIGKQLGMFSNQIDVRLLRSEVAQVAAEFGLDEDEVLREADRWLKKLRNDL